jgi:DNA polymerase
LLGRRESLPKLRHRFHDLSGIPVMPTYHPAYLLEYPEKRREVWEDIKMIIRYLGDTHGPEKSS